MDVAERIRVTEDEYLEAERHASTKSELLHGEVVAMAGGTPRHNAIAANLARAIGNRLSSKPCIVLVSDQRVHCPATGLYTYPHVTVACGPLRFHDKDPVALLNPTAVVEVLSPSTEDYDRGAKFGHYRSIESLREYLIVHQAEPRVEHYQRLPSGQWLLTDLQGLDASVSLPSLECAVSLAEIYDKLELLDDGAA